MRKSVPALLAVSAVVLIFGFLAWAFSLHGTIGLFRVNGFYRRVFIEIALFGLLLFGLTLLYQFLKPRMCPAPNNDTTC
jgi:multisubunit Na+/H+ antiporter MnhG subunit